MNKANRFAADVWKRYQTDGQFQDIVETLGMAGIAAGGQAMATDMSPEEIAVSTALGIGAGLAARPLMARAGYSIGKQIDKRVPNAEDRLGMFSLSSERGRNIYGRILEELGGKEAAERDILLKLLEAKGNQNYIKPDGSKRGYVEGWFGGIGRNRGDNIAQGAVAIGTPFLLGNSGSETDETGQGYLGI